MPSVLCGKALTLEDMPQVSVAIAATNLYSPAICIG